MYVCLCRAVTDKQVNEVIDAGARTVDEVTQACGAGSDCGACRGMIDDMIEDRKLVPCSRLTRPSDRAA